jgi:hypothetical protein
VGSVASRSSAIFLAPKYQTSTHNPQSLQLPRSVYSTSDPLPHWPESDEAKYEQQSSQQKQVPSVRTPSLWWNGRATSGARRASSRMRFISARSIGRVPLPANPNVGSTEKLLVLVSKPA